MAESLLEKLKREEISEEEMTLNIFMWARDQAQNLGRKISEEVFDWHTETHHTLSLEGYSIEVGDGFSMYGGSNVKISKGLGVLFSAYRDGSGTMSQRQVEPFEEWLTPLDPYISGWVLAQDQAQVERKRIDVDINTRRSTAVDMVTSTPIITGLKFAHKMDWERSVEDGKERGWIGADEEWSKTVIAATLTGICLNNTVFIDEQHPEFQSWKEMKLGQKVSLGVREVPVGYILPDVMRWVKIVVVY